MESEGLMSGGLIVGRFIFFQIGKKIREIIRPISFSPRKKVNLLACLDKIIGNLKL